MRWNLKLAGLALAICAGAGAGVAAVRFNGVIGALPTMISPAELSEADVSAYHEAIVQAPLPRDVVTGRQVGQADVAELAGAGGREILFGDLHVHTTYSDDAFWFGLPMFAGAFPVRPPASACNYARYVSQLDFFALTDHAESYLPAHWRSAIDAIRHCNAAAGDPRNPDTVAFMGYEWTAIGRLPEEHYGHHNVIFRDLDERSLPLRPIAYSRNVMGVKEEWLAADPNGRDYYQAFLSYLAAHKAVPDCRPGQPTRAQPADCFEFAKTTGQLLRKLDELGSESIVIPHGMAWGWSAPLDISWANELRPENHDNRRMPLLEVYSGHGNSEPFRDVAARRFDASGKPYCPNPTPNYLPTCWRAGQIMEERCLKAGEPASACRTLAERTRQRFVEVKTAAGWLTIPGATVEDWLDAGQPRDVFLPAMNYRPQKSAQAAIASTNFDNGTRNRLIWGFIASSDNHRSRPSNGFKQVNRIANTDGSGAREERLQIPYLGRPAAPTTQIVDIPNDSKAGLPSFGGLEVERQSSFMYMGGLAAVHSDGRDRNAIFAGLKRREVYATSGPRILLWFDLVNAGSSGRDRAPMGSHLTFSRAPRFRVTAAGSFEQAPGCPAYVKAVLQARGLQALAEGECYNPTAQRRPLDRIEVIKITPQARPGEPLAQLIRDPWKVISCKGRTVCSAEFHDPAFTRDSAYYVRVLEAPTPTVNGATLRTEYDRQGRPVRVRPCYDSYKNSTSDDCLAPAQPRAWSSPIYLDRPRRG